MKREVYGRIADLYTEHLYIRKDLDPKQKEYFDCVYGEDPRFDRWLPTIKVLSSHLRTYYNRRCIVLIDEYDHPLDIAYQNSFYKDARDFFSTLFGNLLKVRIPFDLIC
jgi:hypothetical protein